MAIPSPRDSSSRRTPPARSAAVPTRGNIEPTRQADEERREVSLHVITGWSDEVRRLAPGGR